MTTQNEKPPVESQTEHTPDFYIFAKDSEGNSKRIGAAFKHSKGNGFNILIEKQRYTAFPPKLKP